MHTGSCNFKCLRCKFMWATARPPGPMDCPACGHPYIEWTNYENEDAKPIRSAASFLGMAPQVVG